MSAAIPIRTKRVPKQYRLPGGKLGNGKDVYVALRNVEAELCFIEGGVLVDRDRTELSSILKGLLTDKVQRELLTAVRSMVGFFKTRSPRLVCWSPELDRLETVFRAAVTELQEASCRAAPLICDEQGVIQPEECSIDPAVRLVFLWSSLFLLGAECDLLNRQAAVPKKMFSVA